MAQDHATIMTYGWTHSARAADAPASVQQVDQLLQQLALLEREQTATAAILELISKIESADHTEAACRIAAEEVKQFLECEQAAIGLITASGTMRLSVLSGVTEVDRASEVTRAIEAALTEATLKKALTCLPLGNNSSSALAHRNLYSLFGNQPLATLPLLSRSGTAAGTLLVVGQATETIQGQRFLSALAEPLATALVGKFQIRTPKVVRWLRTLSDKRSLLRPRTCAATLAAVIAIALLPLPYKVRCSCALQPTVRRFVAAPYEGIFEKSLVKPGDVVKHDQVLALMDGRELRLEQATLAAEEERARKSRDVNMATGKIAAAQIDALEVQRLEIKQNLVMQRSKQLEIRSPLAGLLISGDLERSQGVPVKAGQPLYEVAPLERMVIEIAIADDQIAHVSPGQRVQVRLDAHPGRVWEGALGKVHPRSEVREHDNVFIGEVFVDNADHLLLPGMKGQAKIVTDRHTLAWIVLHRPWHRVASLFGW